MRGRALLARNLRLLRVGRGISQQDLAADTGVDRAYISQLEREDGNATVDLLDRLAQELGVPLAEFFRVPGKSEKIPDILPSGRPKRRRMKGTP